MSKRSTKPYAGSGPATTFNVAIDIPSSGWSDIDFSATLYPGKQPIDVGFYSGLYSIQAERRSDLGESLPFDVISIASVRNTDSVIPGNVRFSIDKASGSRFQDNDGANRTRGAFLEYFKGGEGYSSSFEPRKNPWDFTKGIILRTVEDGGDDLVLFNGIGARDFGSETYVDRGVNYITVFGGNDAVIGGYGKDFIGSQNISDYQALIQSGASPLFTPVGTKFYVGGSASDLLDGGRDSDFLVGDRFNGYELYLPSDVLGEVPLTWKSQVDAIRAFQPKGYTDTTGAGFERLGNFFTGFPTSHYPLWIPGNDVIRGYDGDDTIYGDDNTISQNLGILTDIRKWIQNIPRSVSTETGLSKSSWDDGSFKMGADFINAGPGNDKVDAGVGADAIIGGAGADLIDCGPQIVVEGFPSFFGPKIIFGGNATLDPVTGKWMKDASTSEPDLFMIGGIYDTDTELTSAAVNTSNFGAVFGERNTVGEKLAGFEKMWKDAGKIVKLIPTVGSVLTFLVDATVKSMKLGDPDPSKLTATVPKAIDAMTIIRDFDSVDQLSIRVPKGANLTYDYNILGADVSSNPLGAGLTGRHGLYLRLDKSAGDPFQRVFLEGVTNLVKLGITSDNDGTTWNLGGSDYASILDGSGNQVYEYLRQ